MVPEGDILEGDPDAHSSASASGSNSAVLIQRSSVLSLGRHPGCSGSRRVQTTPPTVSAGLRLAACEPAEGALPRAHQGQLLIRLEEGKDLVLTASCHVVTLF